MNTVTFRLSKHKPAQAIALAVLVLATNPSYATNYTFSDLGTITGPYAGTSAVANSINNLGQVTGYDNVNALVWNGDTATPLSNLPGGLTAYGQDINDAGQVAGINYYGPAADLYHPIRWDGGVATQLDTLGFGYYNPAFGINNHGQVVGSSYTGAALHAVRWESATISDLGTLGGTASEAWKINDSGQAVGYSYTTGDASTHATLWNGNALTDLGTLGGTNSTAENINNAGQIVGWSLLPDEETTHAVVWNGATLTDLAALGGTGTTSYAFDINSSGQIAGFSEIAAGSSHATLWDGNSLVDLNIFLPENLIAAGWVLTLGTGINDHGVIVGWAQQGLDPATALTAAFKLTPAAVPLPGALWLFGSALASFIGMKRRKQEVTA